MNGLQTELVGELVVLRVDVNSPTGRELTAEYGSRVTPTFIFFDSAGEELWRQFGTLDRDRVRASMP